MPSRVILFALLLLLLLIPVPALAGSGIVDADFDLVPDAFDNCTTIANGPNDASNQLDCEPDGFGDACDADYDNNGATTTVDFDIFFQCFTGVFTTVSPSICACVDPDANGATTTTDFTTFFDYFSNDQAPPGPSGLNCAGTIPCTP